MVRGRAFMGAVADFHLIGWGYLNFEDMTVILSEYLSLVPTDIKLPEHLEF